MDQYKDNIEDFGCFVIDLDYYDSYNFNQPDTTIDTTADNGSNTPGFSLIIAISTVAFLLTRRIKSKKNI